MIVDQVTINAGFRRGRTAKSRTSPPNKSRPSRVVPQFLTFKALKELG
jgi:hypothetical protein